MYLFMYVHVCVCVYLHVYTHTHAHMFYRSNTCHKTGECESGHDYTTYNTYKLKTYDRTPNNTV
jgi:hypothetical protein